MNIRPLDLLDLPNLYRFRGEAISLDSARTLTRGNPLGAMGLLSYINPARHIYSAVANGDGAFLVGGVSHTRGEPFAKLLYLAPSSHLDHPDLPALIENLSSEAGTWGAFHVLAEVDETSDAFPALRVAGFSVYAWQRMWDVSEIASFTGVTGASSVFDWTRAKDEDLPAIQSLYHQIVPPLLHPVESIPQRAIGFICNEEVRCYVSLFSGMIGILLTPLIHPEATKVGVKLSSLVGNLPNRGARPVYLCVRSYQAWLEPVLADLGAKAAARQAVMVKHLARLVKEEQTVKAVQPAGVSVQPSRVETKE